MIEKRERDESKNGLKGDYKREVGLFSEERECIADVNGSDSAYDKNNRRGDEDVPGKHGNEQADHRQEKIGGKREVCFAWFGAQERCARDPEKNENCNCREEMDPHSPETTANDFEGTERGDEEKLHGAGEPFGAKAVCA